MKRSIFLLSLTMASFCSAAEKLPPGHPPVDMDYSKAPKASDQLAQKATVLDVINVPQYTYLEVKQENQSRWIAAPSVEVKKGDSVQFDNGLLMSNFHSKALDRTFPTITFVNRVAVFGPKN